MITRQELTRAYLEKGTELGQALADSLFALPSSDDPDGLVVLLPQPTTKLPREKHVRFWIVAFIILVFFFLSFNFLYLQLLVLLQLRSIRVVVQIMH